MRRAFLIIILMLIWGRQAQAGEYAVGTSETITSIGAAFALMASQAGSIPATETITVSVDAGTYVESAQAPTILQPLAIVGVAGEYPTLKANSQAYGIYVSGVANVSISGFIIENYSQAGIYLVNCSSSQILNNTLENNATEISLQNCPSSLVHGNTLYPNNEAILLQSSGSSTISYNTSSPTASESNYTNGFTLTNSASCNINQNQISYSLNGIALIGSNAVTVSANAILAPDGIEGISLDNSSDCWIRNNLAVGQQTGIDLQFSNAIGIHNNTIYEEVANGLRVKSSSNVQLRNNIIISNGNGFSLLDASSQNSLDSQYNTLWGGTFLVAGYANTYADLSAWQATGNDVTNSIASSNPQFAQSSESSPADFKLQNSSPCVGLAQNLSSLFTNDYFNDLRPPSGAWDQGFAALNSAPPTPTPSFTPSPVLPTATITPTFTATPSPQLSPSPLGSHTFTPPPSQTPTVTQTYTATPYPIHAGQLLSYPNPYHPNLGSALNFVFDPGDNVAIRIFDIAGGFVAEIPASNILASQGYASWNGQSASGQKIPPGLYFAVERSSNGSHFCKLTILY
jgi:parallel beta-helix repeat protein